MKDGKFELLTVCIDQQQDWIENYGLTRSGNLEISFYHGNKAISIRKLAKKIQEHDMRGANISPAALTTKPNLGDPKAIRSNTLSICPLLLTSA